MANVWEKAWQIFDERDGTGKNKKANLKYIKEVEEKELSDEHLVFYHKPAPFTIFPDL